jgi:glutathione S-transferase
MFGDKITYIDLSLFQVLRALEGSFAADWAAANYCPQLKAFKERIAARPNIATYLKSPRAKPMMSHSMM